MLVHYDNLGAMELLEQYKYLSISKSLVKAFYILLKGLASMKFHSKLLFVALISI